MTQDINRFQAEAVQTMDSETRIAWDALSQDEKKLIAAQAWFFKENYNEQQTRKLLKQYSW